MTEDIIPNNEEQVEAVEPVAAAETVEEVEVTADTEASAETPAETSSEEEKPKKPKKAKYYIPIEVGQEMTGKIKTVADFGAFVDLGLTVDGLVHISQLSRRRVEKVADVVSPGDEVTVWVKSVDTNRGRVGLTMIKPVERRYNQISEGDVLEGEVKRVESFGVFVDVGLEREGLVHVSELAHDYVKSPSEIISEGDTVQVKVLKVDGRKKQVNLSIKALIDPPPSEEGGEMVAVSDEEAFSLDEQESIPTAMAIAFGVVDDRPRRNTRTRKPKAKTKARRRNRQMDDLVARTLETGDTE